MLRIVDLNSVTAGADVTQSLLDCGFVVVENHAISLDELRVFYEAWAHFFLSDERDDYLVDPESQSGYFPAASAETAKNSEAQDLKEYFQYRPECSMPALLRSMTTHYYDELFSLGKTVLGWIEQYSPSSLWQSLDQPLAEYLVPGRTMLRVLRYPPLTGNEPGGAIRAAAHEDIDFITLLPAATMPGLEIKPKGNGWLPVNAPAGSIIINMGDMMQELTQGALPSTTHRVVNLEGADASLARITAPLFCHPKDDLVLSERYTAGEYLDKRLSQINPTHLRPRNK